MSNTVTSYAVVLLSLSVPPADVQTVKEIFQTVPQLPDVFSNPTISETEKFSVIDKLFPNSLCGFLKVACRENEINSILDIISEFEALVRERDACALAVLEYVTPPTAAQEAAIKKFVCAKSGKTDVQLQLQENPSLLGGFILHIGDQTYDRSLRKSFREMQKSLTRR